MRKKHFGYKNLNLSIFYKYTDSYVGNIVLILSSKVNEIGIDIVKEYRNKGIGFDAVKLLIEHAKEVSGVDVFEIRICFDNMQSRRLFEKPGAVKKGIEDSEFITAVRLLTNNDNIAKKCTLRKSNKELFERAEENSIIVYELKC